MKIDEIKIQAISKNGFWFKIPALERRGRHGGHEFQTGGILLYFEDLKFMSNTDIGPKDFFKMACKKNCIMFSIGVDIKGMLLY